MGIRICQRDRRTQAVRLARPALSLSNLTLPEQVIEQDHRFIKKRIHGESRLPFSGGAWRTIEGYEAMHAIRKGQVRWVAKGDPLAHRQFIHTIFGVAAWSR